jgi:hypothetical protein
MNYKKSLITLVSSYLLISCGGGGGGSSVPPVVSYVVDAPVQGLAYSCGALTGTTGSDGSFLHDSGAACTFKIGNVTIGAFNSAPTDGVVTPHDLAGVSRGDSLNASAVAIAQFLQSLDDGTVEGRIKIPTSVVTALSSVSAQKIVDGTTILSQNMLTNLVSTATNNSKTLVSAATAGAAMNTFIQTTYPSLDVSKGSAAKSSSSSSTTAPTVPAPTLTAQPPSSLTAVLNSVGLTSTTDIASVGYYVVLPASASAPNKWQIVAGTDASNRYVSLSGSFKMSGGTAATQTISGLSFSTDYKIYFVAANASQTSKMTDVVTSSVNTGAEPKAPVISGTFPITLTPNSNATSFSVTTDVSGTGYWVVLPDKADPPSAAQIIAGIDSVGTAVSISGNAAFTGGTSKTYSITGLAYQNAYKLYFVAVNSLDSKKITSVLSASIPSVCKTTIDGIVQSNQTYLKEGSPYCISDNLQIPDTKTVTFQAGTSVFGGVITVQGTLNLAGNSTSNVNFENVQVVPAGLLSSGHSINISWSTFSKGKLYAATGNAVYGSLNVSDSNFNNLSDYIYLWYPIGDNQIVRNRFLNSGGISFGISFGGSSYAKSLTIKNNYFSDWTTDYAIQNWAQYGQGTTLIENNTFATTYKVALKLPGGYIGSALNAPNNFWNTTNTKIIDAMIFDKTDDITSAGFVTYLPILLTPSTETPLIVDKVLKP